MDLKRCAAEHTVTVTVEEYLARMVELLDGRYCNVVIVDNVTREKRVTMMTGGSCGYTRIPGIDDVD